MAYRAYCNTIKIVHCVQNTAAPILNILITAYLRLRRGMYKLQGRN